LALRSNAHRIIDEVHIVTEQCVPAVLRNNTKGDEKCQPITIPLSAQEIHIGACLFILELKTKGLFDFTEFELHGGVVGVPVGMVFRQG